MAHVTFETEEEASIAILGLNDMTMNGYKL